MDFKELILPNFVLANLYKDVLIEDAEASKTHTQPVKQHIQLSFLGNNKKNIVLVVQDETAVYVTDDILALLTNLLTACRLTIADIALLNISNKKISYKQVTGELQPSYLLLMGIDAKQFQIPLIFPEYKIQHYNNCQMLITQGLDTMLGESREAKMQKSKLWLCLKELFKVG